NETVKTYTVKYSEIKTEANDGSFEVSLGIAADELRDLGAIEVKAKYTAVVSEVSSVAVQAWMYFEKNAEDAVWTNGEAPKKLVALGATIADKVVGVEQPTRDDYNFVGYKADAAGTEIAADAVMTVDEYTAYAAWREVSTEEVEYRFEAPKDWYIVNEALATDYKLFRVYADGTEDEIDQALYSVEAIPTTNDASYEECLGWHKLGVVFNDTAYGNVYETSFDVFVIPDKLILEEESPLVRKTAADFVRYGVVVTNYLDYDLIMNLAEVQNYMTVEAEFINEYFLNLYTAPESIDVNVRVVNANGAVVTNLRTYIGTGYRVQLVIEGEVYDEVELVVKGDVDGTGRVNATDKNIVSGYISRTATLTGIYFIAADTREDMRINATDKDMISKHIARVHQLFTAWNEATHVYTRDYSTRFPNAVV
ncbi:MAG: dockerin type I repeat-containing protein, partial [Clostridia bacterium]|nr:dockerin type I repeat-containing protein [Clostridia bacterium]